MTDQEQMISNNANHIESLKEEVESNAALLREVQATAERQNRKIEDQENMIMLQNKKIETMKILLFPMDMVFGPLGDVTVLVRKKVGNLVDFFDNSWTEYKEGFAANGERDSF